MKQHGHICYNVQSEPSITLINIKDTSINISMYSFLFMTTPMLDIVFIVINPLVIITIFNTILELQYCLFHFIVFSTK